MNESLINWDLLQPDTIIDGGCAKFRILEIDQEREEFTAEFVEGEPWFGDYKNGEEMLWLFWKDSASNKIIFEESKYAWNGHRASRLLYIITYKDGSIAFICDIER